jgi:CHAT domain-containing protein/tetratricopeptide (TPR) repeat protein
LQAPHIKGVVICLVLFTTNVGSSRIDRSLTGKVLERRQFSENSELAALRTRATALFQAGKYIEAANDCRRGYEKAIRQDNPASALKFLNATGAAWLAGFQYREAMRSFLGARRLAGTLQDWEMSGAVSLNLASLYLQMGEWSGAIEETSRAIAALDHAPRSRYRAQALAQTAKLKARTGDLDEALPAFHAAIREAAAQGDIAFKSQVLNQLGNEYLNKGRLEDAERAMTEAFRLRLLGRNRDIGQSYRSLGLLRMAQGDLKSSEILLTRAVEEAWRNPGRVPNWAVFHARGELRQRQHRLGDALRDFRTGLDLAGRWRLEVLPADTILSSAGVNLEQLFSSFIHAAGELYFETGRASLAAEAFAAAEEIRAASVRAALTRDAHWRDRLPPEYGQALAELRAARTALLRVDSPGARDHIGRLRNRLAEMEVRAGLQIAAEPELDRAPQLAGDVAAALDASEAVFSFRLEEPHSYVWSVTKEGLEMHRFAGAARIRAAAAAFSESVRRNSTDAGAQGERLYAELFGWAPRGVLAKRRWLLAVEDVLLGIPFPALVVDRTEGRPAFLVERHSVSLVPSAMLLRQACRPARNRATVRGRFVGVGDPIYNTADERWTERGTAETALHLPRLAGSAREIGDSARAWGAPEPPVLLEGADATRQALARALATAPAVVHFATHVVRSKENPGRRLIPLSLLPGGDPDLVGPEEIASWRLRELALVVMSGCASGAPEPRIPAFGLVAEPLAPEPPAELGLVGLARAWLSAGAGAVAVTLWPTPDDTGELFQSFYGHLGETGGLEPAVALERAQIDMLESKTWRSFPKYWAAYLIVGRGN